MGKTNRTNTPANNKTSYRTGGMVVDPNMGSVRKAGRNLKRKVKK